MKIAFHSLRPVFASAALVLTLVGLGCTRDQNTAGTPERKRIPLAPVGAFSPGIGAPGAGSMDTRGTGTIATGQGDNPLGDPDPGAVSGSGAGTVPGARNGGRQPVTVGPNGGG